MKGEVEIKMCVFGHISETVRDTVKITINH